jgi:hypothetical protein
VITDFPKGNQGGRQAVINSDSLQNAFVMIDGERGTKICRQVFLAESMGIEKDPSETDKHARGRCLRAVSDQILVAEIQNRGSFMQSPSSGGRTTLILGRQVEIEAFLQKCLSQVPA